MLSNNAFAAIQNVGYSAAQYLPLVRMYSDLKARMELLAFFLDTNEGEDKIPPSKLTTITQQQSLCFSFMSQLDLNNTIDQRPPVYRQFYKYLNEWPATRLKDYIGRQKCPAVQDVWSIVLAKGTRSSRKAAYIERIDTEIAQATQNDWFLVFDTLTIDPELEDRFFEDKYALRDHFRNLSRRVNRRLGRRVDTPCNDAFRYFAVPEYGSEGGRLHFHCIYFFRVLPKGCTDPITTLTKAHHREIRALKCWRYGFSAPIAVRYSGDAFTKLGWRWPTTKEGKPIETNPPIAVGRYVSKYITKSEGQREQWKKITTRNPLQFRIRMSRKFGLMINLSMLSLPGLLEVTRLHYSATSKPKSLRLLAQQRLSLLLGKTSLKDFTEAVPNRTPLLEQLRALTQKNPPRNQRSLYDQQTPLIKSADLSNEVRRFLRTVPRCRNGVTVSAR